MLRETLTRSVNVRACVRACMRALLSLLVRSSHFAAQFHLLVWGVLLFEAENDEVTGRMLFASVFFILKHSEHQSPCWLMSWDDLH